MIFRTAAISVSLCIMDARFTFNISYTLYWFHVNARLIFYWLCHLFIDKKRINLIEPFHCDLCQLLLTSHKSSSQIRNPANWISDKPHFQFRLSTQCQRLLWECVFFRIGHIPFPDPPLSHISLSATRNHNKKKTQLFWHFKSNDDHSKVFSPPHPHEEHEAVSNVLLHFYRFGFTVFPILSSFAYFIGTFCKLAACACASQIVKIIRFDSSKRNMPTDSLRKITFLIALHARSRFRHLFRAHWIFIHFFIFDLPVFLLLCLSCMHGTHKTNAETIDLVWPSYHHQDDGFEMIY